jgi:hypothetical protein
LREAMAERLKAMEMEMVAERKVLQDQFRAFQAQMAAVLAEQRGEVVVAGGKGVSAAVAGGKEVAAAVEGGKGVELAAVKGDDVISTSF